MSKTMDIVNGEVMSYNPEIFTGPNKDVAIGEILISINDNLKRIADELEFRND